MPQSLAAFDGDLDAIVRDGYDIELLDNHDAVVERRSSLVHDDGSVDCHECGKNYDNRGVAVHWSTGGCSHPLFTLKQWEILIGSLMGDATVDRTNKNPYLVVYNIQESYLKHIRRQFPLLMRDVSLLQTAEESALESREYGFDSQADPESYHDMFYLHARCTPHLEKLEKWYSTGEKVFDKEIKLTSTILRHWYCQDGGLCVPNSSGDHNGYCVISSHNEKDNQEEIKRMFSEVGFDVSYPCTEIRISTGDTERFLEYIGPSPPGFLYKWQHQDYDAYHFAKDWDRGDL